MGTVIAIDEGHLRALIGQDFHLLQRLVQGVAVIRVTWKRLHGDDETAFGGGGDADLRAELTALVLLSF